MLRNEAYLLDILNEARLVGEYLQGVDRTQFEQNIVFQRAAVRSIEIIGEAARRISEDFQTLYPAIPWRVMIGMRNRLIHQYDEIDLAVVWETVQVDLPELVVLIEPLMIQLLPPGEPDAVGPENQQP